MNFRMFGKKKISRDLWLSSYTGILIFLRKIFVIASKFI